MTRPEFANAMAYLTAGVGKALTEDQLEVYFDCLKDLPFEVLMVSAKRVLMEHRWPSFPSIAELRGAAAATAQGRVVELSPAEAWQMAWAAIAKIDPEVEGRYERVTKNLPPLVVQAIEAFGVQAMCYGTEPVGVVRGQFIKIYEQLAEREKRVALLPAPVKKAIEDIGRVPRLTAGIGQEVPQ